MMRTRSGSAMGLYLSVSAFTVEVSSSGMSSTGRMVLLPPVDPAASQSEKDGRAFAGSAEGPYAPAVPVHDALDRGQADPDAGELLLAVQALERAEQFIRVGHVEARTV